MVSDIVVIVGIVADKIGCKKIKFIIMLITRRKQTASVQFLPITTIQSETFIVREIEFVQVLVNAKEKHLVDQ